MVSSSRTAKDNNVHATSDVFQGFKVQLRLGENSMPFPKCKPLLSKTIVLLFELLHAGGDGSMLMRCGGWGGDGEGDRER